MNEYTVYIISMVVTGIFILKKSIKNNWSKKLWDRLVKSQNFKRRISLWIVFVIVGQILIQLFLEFMSIDMTIIRIILGILMGFALALMPNMVKVQE